MVASRASRSLVVVPISFLYSSRRSSVIEDLRLVGEERSDLKMRANEEGLHLYVGEGDIDC